MEEAQTYREMRANKEVAHEKRQDHQKGDSHEKGKEYSKKRNYHDNMGRPLPAYHGHGTLHKTDSRIIPDMRKMP